MPPLLSLTFACTPEDATSERLPGDPHGRLLHFEADGGEVRCTDGAESHRLAGGTDVKVHGLLADTEYTCTNGVQSVRFTTESLPYNLPLPEVEIAADTTTVGYRLTNVWRNISDENEAIRSSDAFLVIFDAEGRPRWQQEGAYGADTDVSWVDGNVLVGGFSGDEEGTNTAPTLLDLEGRELARGLGAEVVENEVPGSWHHDAGMGLDGTHVHALTREYFEDGITQGFVIHAVDMATGTTDWAWSAVEDGFEKGLPAPEDGHEDPWHANAVWEVEEDGARALWVSLNESGAVVRIDMETKAITDTLAADSGWTMVDADTGEAMGWLARQHDVKVYDDDTMVVFDNGYLQTRVLKLRIDREAKVAYAEQAWSEPAFYVDRWGGVDLVGDALDIARPHWEADDAPATLLRLEADGTESWRMAWDDWKVSVYRSDTIPFGEIFSLEP